MDSYIRSILKVQSILLQDSRFHIYIRTLACVGTPALNIEIMSVL